MCSAVVWVIGKASAAAHRRAVAGDAVVTRMPWRTPAARSRRKASCNAEPGSPAARRRISAGSQGGTRPSGSGQGEQARRMQRQASSGQMLTLIQRYIIRVERERKARESGML